MYSDKIYKDAQNKFGEYQLRLYGDFLNQQNRTLDRLLFWNYNEKNNESISLDLKNVSSTQAGAASIPTIPTIDVEELSCDFNQFYLNAELSSFYLTKRYVRPIELNNSLQNHENIKTIQMTRTENVMLNKIILTFHQLCCECNEICDLCKKYAIKFLFINEDLCSIENLFYMSVTMNENVNNNSSLFSNASENCFLKISKSLRFLCDIQYLIQYCIIVGTTILKQLAALFLNEIDICIDNFKLQPVFCNLGKLLRQLIIFDEIFAKSHFLKFWTSYKKTLTSINGNQQILNEFSETEINGLSNVLNDLECRLFSGNLFQNFLDSMYKIKQQLNTKSIGQFSKQFSEYIHTCLQNIAKYPIDLSELHETDKFIEINALCVLYHNFFGQLDQKYLKNLIEYNLKYIGITLIGNIIWCPEQFLRKHAETLIKSYDKYFMDATKLRHQNLQMKIQNLRRDVKIYCTQISLWTLHMKSLLQTTICDFKSENFKQATSLFLQGLQYSGQLTYTIKSITNLHHLLHLEMQESCILAICKLIEYLKIIQQIYLNNSDFIFKMQQCTIQYLQYRGLMLIEAAKKRLETESYSDRNIDALTALQIAEKCLLGTSSKSRLTLIDLAINSSNPTNVFSSDYKKFQKILYRIDLLSQLQDHLKELCEPSFMYWNQSQLLINFHNNEDTSPEIFNHLIKYSDDCCKFLKQLNLHYIDLVDEMIKNNNKKYKNEILDKLCIQTEMFLRIEANTENLQRQQEQNQQQIMYQNQQQQQQHNQQSQQQIQQLNNQLLNPYTETIYDNRDTIKKIQLQMSGKHIILKNDIENYLSHTFYNLTTISLHDWKIYSEMRHLAQSKFNLYTIDDYLPNQTLEQGIDVLEIMRNIHIFVSNYRYNMNNQIFVEQITKNKHLNTIGIQHIANSLRTHGTGILNTSVNFTYQFLRKKFYTFSQFLYDEQIRSRLIKDLKYFRDNCETLNQMYPYERADNFNKSIRKLGLMVDGQSYLDLFRQLITHIGNAIGYVRLIRSGNIHTNYNAGVFLPSTFDDENKTNQLFSELIEGLNLSEVIQKAAKNLDDNIKNFQSNTSDHTNYFHLLLDAFSGFFRNPKNIHLKAFYLIVPPLTVNFVEYMLMSKEKIYKSDNKMNFSSVTSLPINQSNNNNLNGYNNSTSSSSSLISGNINNGGALFFDDGFAIGLTYILKLLDQISEFNSLHWFKSIKHKFKIEREKIQKQQQDILSSSDNYSLNNEKLQQTLSLTEKRLRAYEIEFNLLHYNLSSAKIFFQ